LVEFNFDEINVVNKNFKTVKNELKIKIATVFKLKLLKLRNLQVYIKVFAANVTTKSRFVYFSTLPEALGKWKILRQLLKNFP
jgi:hypothetical protein